MFHESERVTNYIQNFTGDVRDRLLQIRALIKVLAPQAVESISYGMPAYKFKKKPLIYFAAYPNHIGLYALPKTNDFFKNEFANYKTSKGSIQFQHKEPLPISLIKKIINYRIKEVDSLQKLKNQSHNLS